MRAAIVLAVCALAACSRREDRDDEERRGIVLRSGVVSRRPAVVVQRKTSSAQDRFEELLVRLDAIAAGVDFSSQIESETEDEEEQICAIQPRVLTAADYVTPKKANTTIRCPPAPRVPAYVRMNREDSFDFPLGQSTQCTPEDAFEMPNCLKRERSASEELSQDMLDPKRKCAKAAHGTEHDEVHVSSSAGDDNETHNDGDAAESKAAAALLAIERELAAADMTADELLSSARSSSFVHGSALRALAAMRGGAVGREAFVKASSSRFGPDHDRMRMLVDVAGVRPCTPRMVLQAVSAARNSRMARQVLEAILGLPGISVHMAGGALLRASVYERTTFGSAILSVVLERYAADAALPVSSTCATNLADDARDSGEATPQPKTLFLLRGIGRVRAWANGWVDFKGIPRTRLALLVNALVRELPLLATLEGVSESDVEALDALADGAISPHHGLRAVVRGSSFTVLRETLRLLAAGAQRSTGDADSTAHESALAALDYITTRSGNAHTASPIVGALVRMIAENRALDIAARYVREVESRRAFPAFQDLSVTLQARFLDALEESLRLADTRADASAASFVLRVGSGPSLVDLVGHAGDTHPRLFALVLARADAVAKTHALVAAFATRSLASAAALVHARAPVELPALVRHAFAARVGGEGDELLRLLRAARAAPMETGANRVVYAAAAAADSVALVQFLEDLVRVPRLVEGEIAYDSQETVLDGPEDADAEDAMRLYVSRVHLLRRAIDEAPRAAHGAARVRAHVEEMLLATGPPQRASPVVLGQKDIVALVTMLRERFSGAELDAQLERFLGQAVRRELVPANGTAAECAVCLESIACGHVVVRISDAKPAPKSAAPKADEACEHIFHAACIGRWQTEYSKTACPLCRRKLPARVARHTLIVAEAHEDGRVCVFDAKAPSCAGACVQQSQDPFDAASHARLGIAAPDAPQDAARDDAVFRPYVRHDRDDDAPARIGSILQRDVTSPHAQRDVYSQDAQRDVYSQDAQRDVYSQDAQRDVYTQDAAMLIREIEMNYYAERYQPGALDAQRLFYSPSDDDNDITNYLV